MKKSLVRVVTQVLVRTLGKRIGESGQVEELRKVCKERDNVGF